MSKDLFNPGCGEAEDSIREFSNCDRMTAHHVYDVFTDVFRGCFGGVMLQYSRRIIGSNEMQIGDVQSFRSNFIMNMGVTGSSPSRKLQCHAQPATVESLALSIKRGNSGSAYK
ncbi:hypothetical protein Ancab_010966 [Ancistrocladus abbreviatus]